VAGAFAYQGQICISVQRIYVHTSLYQRFVEGFVQQSKQLRLGDPMLRETDVSAMIHLREVERALSWIEEAKELGARIMIGGSCQGNILEPTVILEADANLKVSCQEVFAPVVLIHSFDRLEEAIQQVNQSRYGLQAGIFTQSIQSAQRAIEQLHVGAVLVNDIPTYRMDHMPYGGVKESGLGREGLRYAIEEMTEMKLVIYKK